MHFIQLLSENPVLPVALPNKHFVEIHQKFHYGSPQNRGLLVETSLSLSLKRLFPEETTFIKNQYCFADLLIQGDYIDIKATNHKSYDLRKLSQSKVSKIQNTPADFYFILAWPDEWDEKDSIIRIRIHQIIHLTQDGQISYKSLSGSYKEFLNP